MNKANYPDHDLVEYDDYDTMINSVESRCTEGDLKSIKLFCVDECSVTVEKLDKDHNWVFYRAYTRWSDFYVDEKLISLKICPEVKNTFSMPYKYTDYVFPRTNIALLSLSRTENVRQRRRVKPAKVVRREEEEV